MGEPPVEPLLPREVFDLGALHFHRIQAWQEKPVHTLPRLCVEASGGQKAWGEFLTLQLMRLGEGDPTNLLAKIEGKGEEPSLFFGFRCPEAIEHGPDLTFVAISDCTGSFDALPGMASRLTSEKPSGGYTLLIPEEKDPDTFQVWEIQVSFPAYYWLLGLFFLGVFLVSMQDQDQQAPPEDDALTTPDVEAPEQDGISLEPSAPYDF